MAKAQATTDTKCYFLDIPPELRLIIYEYLFSSLPPWNFNTPVTFSKARMKHLQPALLNTCTLIRREGTAEYKKGLEALRKVQQDGWNYTEVYLRPPAGSSPAHRIYRQGLLSDCKKDWQLRDAALAMEIKKCE